MWRYRSEQSEPEWILSYRLRQRHSLASASQQGLYLPESYKDAFMTGLTFPQRRIAPANLDTEQGRRALTNPPEPAQPAEPDDAQVYTWLLGMAGLAGTIVQLI